MLAHFRDEAAEWRDRARRNGKRKVGAYDLRTIAASLRHHAEREEIATGWHPLRATADAFDAEAAPSTFRSMTHPAPSQSWRLPPAVRRSPPAATTVAY